MILEGTGNGSKKFGTLDRSSRGSAESTEDDYHGDLNYEACMAGS